MNDKKSLEDMIPEMEFKIIRELAIMAEQDPDDDVKKSVRQLLSRRYQGQIFNTASFGDSIYVDVLKNNVHDMYYVCDKVDYGLEVPKIDDDFFK
ncbi:MAG: hypothetical protein ACLFNK_04345 [Candidatus Woesearchaeota archaeon]